MGGGELVGFNKKAFLLMFSTTYIYSLFILTYWVEGLVKVQRSAYVICGLYALYGLLFE